MLFREKLISQTTSCESPIFSIFSAQALCALRLLSNSAKSPRDFKGFSLCYLCVLCASVVKSLAILSNHRDTENTEIAQRRTKVTSLNILLISS